MRAVERMKKIIIVLICTMVLLSLILFNYNSVIATKEEGSFINEYYKEEYPYGINFKYIENDTETLAIDENGYLWSWGRTSDSYGIQGKRKWQRNNVP